MNGISVKIPEVDDEKDIESQLPVGMRKSSAELISSVNLRYNVLDMG